LNIHKKKPILTEKKTDRAWFCHLLRHPAREQSGSILTTPEPMQGCCKEKFMYGDHREMYVTR